MTEKGAGDWKRLHNEELHNLYASQNIMRVIHSRRMRRAKQVARMEEMKNSYNVLGGKPETKRPLRFGLIWEDNIVIDLMDIWWEVWIGCI
jgi:hypothetical protein